MGARGVTSIPAGELVEVAARANHGLAAFNVVHLESAEAIVAAAERTQRAVILQISENCVRYHGALAPITVACQALAAASGAPVGVHLDHATSGALVDEAVELGLRSVMFDAAMLDYADNVAATREVVSRCHERNVWVEAEIGEIGGKDGGHSTTARTDPMEAARYARDTGADALAVAVGTSHAMVSRDAVLDVDLISAIKAAVGLPLVLHGSSGAREEDLRRAIECGMTKINIATRLSAAWTGTIRNQLRMQPHVVDSRTFSAAARDAVAAEAEHLMKQLNSLPADAFDGRC